jgi:hypothetical protein
MKQLPLTQGKVSLVDDDVYEWAKDFKWFAYKSGRGFYAARQASRKEFTKRKLIHLHHCVIGFPLNKMQVDHKDGNGLNNQRTNLRIVTQRVNGQNLISHRAGKLVGVSLIRGKYWRATIHVNGEGIHLGYFPTEQEAHEAYMKAAQIL